MRPRMELCFSSGSEASLVLSVMALHRIEQLLGVIADAIFEDNLDVFNVGDASGGITFYH